MGWAIVGDVPEWRLVPAGYKWCSSHILLESSAGRLILVNVARDSDGNVVKEIPVKKPEITCKNI